MAPANRRAVSACRFCSAHSVAARKFPCSISNLSSHTSCCAPSNSGSPSSASLTKKSVWHLRNSSASPLAASCSRPNSVIVSNIMNRGSPSANSLCCNRLLSTSDVTPSSASISRSPTQLHTFSTAWRSHPPTKTDSRRNSFCSFSSSRS